MSRAWKRTLADRSTLDAIADAARALMAQICDHAPEDCTCEANLMTPMEVADWIQREVLLQAGKPQRLDHHENRSAGQQVRRSMEMAVTA